jgi:predicted ArsR family transcriptional regulator
MYSHLETLEQAKLIKRVKISFGNAGRPTKYWVDYSFDEKVLQASSLEERIKNYIKDGSFYTVKGISEALGKRPPTIAVYMNNLLADKVVEKIYQKGGVPRLWRVQKKQLDRSLGAPLSPTLRARN